MVRAARDARAVLTVLAILAVVVGAPLLYQGYRELDDRQDVDRVALQLAGGREAACRVIQPGAPGCPVPEAAVERYAAAVRADWLLVAGYVLAGVGVFGLGALFLSGSGARRVARWCVGGVLLAAAADTVENLALLRGLGDPAQQPGDTPFAVAASLAVLKFAVAGPLLVAFVVVGSVLLGRRLHGPSRVRRREDANPPEIARASELDSGTDRRPDIILPPAVADASTATISATVGQSGPDVQQELYTKAGRDRAVKVAAASTGGHPHPDLPGPARPRPAGRTPAGSRRGGHPRRSGSAPRAAGSARPRSPWGRSRRSSTTSCRGPATWCRCPAAAT